MPRFFFHIANGEEVADEEGAVLPYVTTALNVALASAREIIAEELKHGKALSLDDRIEIHDQSGCIVGVVTFREAVDPRGQLE